MNLTVTIRKVFKVIADFAKEAETHIKVEKESIKRWQNKRRQENRENVYQYLLKHPCIDCGESDPIVLEFDHIKPKEARNKSISMVTGSNWSWRKIMKEIEKCKVRCANCHRRKTSRQLNWYKSARQSDNKKTYQNR